MGATSAGRGKDGRECERRERRGKGKERGVGRGLASVPPVPNLPLHH